MIEKMIAEVFPYLPLKISEVEWDTTQLFLGASGASLTTLSSWRISFKNRIFLGCDDPDSEKIKELIGLDIVDIRCQENLLKVDPVFILSNGYQLEIFSTTTFEPWAFGVNGLFSYFANPWEP